MLEVLTEETPRWLILEGSLPHVEVLVGFGSRLDLCLEGRLERGGVWEES